MSESAYDAEIAPALLALSKRCTELGMPFLAVVEYEPGSVGRTSTDMRSATTEMKALAICARHYRTVDDMMIAVGRWVTDNNVSHNSIVLSNLGIDPDPTKRVRP